MNNLKFDEKGLIPAIVQDNESGEVLMLAYMNAESLKKTMETGATWFYSRSRRELWNKGATSGSYQVVVSISYDCDGDSILIKVRQIGVACHTGSRSCFFNSIKGECTTPNIGLMLTKLYECIDDRAQNPVEESYTNYLLDKGTDKILKKLGEECSEVIIAAKNDSKDEAVYEMADLLYHLTVLMHKQKITYNELAAELYKRYK